VLTIAARWLRTKASSKGNHEILCSIIITTVNRMGIKNGDKIGLKMLAITSLTK
jgi:hypothetical protein